MKCAIAIGVLALCLSACDRAEPGQGSEATTPAAQDPHAGLKQLEVDTVATLLESQDAVPVDANGVDTRQEMGTLPGAILLSDSKSYDLSELPEDKAKNLVFYCGSERCMSAPKAAKRAEAAGYSKVHVMPAGIRGWVKAGKQVDKTS